MYISIIYVYIRISCVSFVSFVSTETNVLYVSAPARSGQRDAHHLAALSLPYPVCDDRPKSLK